MPARTATACHPSCFALRLTLLLLALLLTACGSTTVDVVLPAEVKTATGSSAICRGVVAGKVSAVRSGNPATATVTLESPEVAAIVMRDGVRAYVLDSGDVEFDVTQVTDTAARLPSGSTLVATRRNVMEAAIERWATGWNVTVVVAGLVAMLLILLITRSFARGVAGLARLALSCGLALVVAYLATPPLAPLVERHVYPLLESARSRPVPAPSGSTPTPAPTTPADTTAPSDKAIPQDLQQLADAAADQLGAWGRQAAETLRSRPLPDPVYPTFFAVWLLGFVVLSSMLRNVTRAR